MVKLNLYHKFLKIFWILKQKWAATTTKTKPHGISVHGNQTLSLQLKTSRLKKMQMLVINTRLKDNGCVLLTWGGSTWLSHHFQKRWLDSGCWGGARRPSFQRYFLSVLMCHCLILRKSWLFSFKLHLKATFVIICKDLQVKIADGCLAGHHQVRNTGLLDPQSREFLNCPSMN